MPFSIAIVDKVGNLKAFSSMDGATVLTLEIAQNKAFSAAAYNRATHEWYDRLKDDPPSITWSCPHGASCHFRGGLSNYNER